MATVSHTIYSYYNPENREEVAIHTTQAADETVDDSDAAWHTETSFPTRKLLKSAPHFVPATRSLNNWNAQGSQNNQTGANTRLIENDTSSWYRSLTKGTSTSDRRVLTQFDMPGTSVGTPSTGADLPKLPPRRIDERNKNNWFILRAIQSDSSLLSSTPPPAHTLADILARDPPPSPTEQKYSPPVWLALGPSNKGWAMLQKGGWREGEGLGSMIQRTSGRDEITFPKRSNTGVGSEANQAVIKREKREVNWEDDIEEVQYVDVIDLTLSDSEGVELKNEVSNDVQEIVDTGASFIAPSVSSQTALLTPIPTALKSDRLGIGLKAKTVGPHKASLKRVTHSAAAMAAHIRAAEQTRKKKTELGRGRRGFVTQEKKERENRQKMLAYLNE